jgi:hypothetical protein
MAITLTPKIDAESLRALAQQSLMQVKKNRIRRKAGLFAEALFGFAAGFRRILLLQPGTAAYHPRQIDREDG